MNKQYNLAIAFLQFKIAYQTLVKASKDLPDHDVSEYYPFYLIDFEDVVEPVTAWCNVQATKLLRELPDKVDNPACLYCPDYHIGIGADGLCKASAQNMCKVYPMIVFSKEQVLPILQQHGIEVTQEDKDNDVYLKYLSLLEVLDVKRSEQKKKETTVEQDKTVIIGGPSLSSNLSASICGICKEQERGSTISINLRESRPEDIARAVMRAREADNNKTGSRT